MTAKEFIESEGYRESTEVEGDILNTKELEELLNLYAESKNKELIEENKEYEEIIKGLHWDMQLDGNRFLDSIENNWWPKINHLMNIKHFEIKINKK